MKQRSGLFKLCNYVSLCTGMERRPEIMDFKQLAVVTHGGNKKGVQAKAFIFCFHCLYHLPPT